jgi:primosomal protein N'
LTAIRCAPSRTSNAYLNALNTGELDLLVGTQMIAKGHDIHGVTLVGVVGADIARAA